MVQNTRAMNSSGTASWNRSLIELTNQHTGARRRSGVSSRSG